MIFICPIQICWINQRLVQKSHDFPDSKVHGANMGPPGSWQPQVGPAWVPGHEPCCQGLPDLAYFIMQDNPSLADGGLAKLGLTSLVK